MGSLQDLSTRVVDIGGSNLDETLRNMLRSRMLTPGKQCVLPSALLSDDQGLALWRKINRLSAYYQTNEEVELLESYGSELAEKIAPGTVLLDLGCGDVRKVRPLLDALESKQKRVTYYGLDLSRPSVEEGISQLAGTYQFVECWGLWGTFDDLLRWCQDVKSPKWILSLGSVLGNDFTAPAVLAMARWAATMRPDDRMLLGMDATSNKDKVWQSYHDSEGLFLQFMRGGLEHSNRVLGQAWYDPADWSVKGLWSKDHVMHYFTFTALRDVSCPQIGISFQKGHEIACYEAFKYGPEAMTLQFSQAKLQELERRNVPGSFIYQYLLSAQPVEQA